ncbi:hypothetical protein E9228_000577 [Curtobacterium flaccumfaciens]|uniref:DUF7455 domain-containing protein n=1 Tax=Curtobacterium salicis TaxID=1779862 RepID=A0ABX0T6Y8_9MICO|nr:hypothetical protein [Curtobacterium sp. WW7]NII39958.1 hypothetical protein [Curtobacterium sp. WW7]
MTQTVQDLPVDELSNNHQLTAADRCDSCGAQAYIRATMASGELLFCAHHGAEFKDKLAATALEWHDESSRLRESK